VSAKDDERCRPLKAFLGAAILLQVLEVERNARLVAYYPSVISWLHFKCFSRAHRDFLAISPSNCHPPRENISDVGQ